MAGLAKEITEFIRSLYESDNPIPLHAPAFRGNERKYVLDAIDTTFVSSVGAYVDRAEQMMTAITNTKKAIAVVNGTAGLQIALQLVGVGHGDEVITQALTFVATANAIKFTGADPVFLDVDYDTMGLSPLAVAKFLDLYGEVRGEHTYNKKTGKRIAACVPMHTFGFPVHIEELLSVCQHWNIPVVEDAAESLGSLYKGEHTGNFGQVGVFSFNGNKIVTSGGGGMIVTNDNDLGQQAKHISTTAKIAHPYEYVHDQIGYNYRMPNLNAALLCGQLEQLETFLELKRQLAATYNAFFAKNGTKFRLELPHTRANYWLMCIELDSLEERNEFLQFTNANGVMTRPIWQLMYRLPMYRSCYRDDQTQAAFLEARVVNIPSNTIASI